MGAGGGVPFYYVYKIISIVNKTINILRKCLNTPIFATPLYSVVPLRRLKKLRGVLSNKRKGLRAMRYEELHLGNT